MNNNQFDNSKFFSGQQAKVNDKWYYILSVDFELAMFDLVYDKKECYEKEEIFTCHCEFIQELTND